MFDLAGDLFRLAFFIEMGDVHAFPGQPGFLKKRTHGLRSLVRPEVSFKVSAFTLGARYQDRSVSPGFKRLEHINKLQLPGTGQTYGLQQVVSLQAAALPQDLTVNTVGAVKNIYFQGSIDHISG